MTCERINSNGSLTMHRGIAVEWFKWSAIHNAQDLVARLFNITEVEGVEHTQPFTQHPIPRIQHNPGSKII